MKKNLFLFSSALLCFHANAQVSDTIKKKVEAAITNRFPITRTLDMQFQHYLPADYETEFFGHNFRKGEITNHYKMSAIANIPVVARPKWSLTGSFFYRYEGFELQHTQTNPVFAAWPVSDSKAEFHYLAATASFTYYSMLWKKILVYNTSLTVDGSNEGAERIKGFVAATLLVKRSERTSIGIGLLAFADLTSQFPVVPTLVVEHHFKNSQWYIDFILPQRLLFKHPVLTNGRIAIGSEMNSENFYAYPDSPLFSASVYENRQLELKSGITYEHYLGNGFVTTFKTGLSNVIDSKMAPRGERANDYVLSTKPDATGYFNLGFSYNMSFKKPNSVKK